MKIHVNFYVKCPKCNVVGPKITKVDIYQSPSSVIPGEYCKNPKLIIQKISYKQLDEEVV